MKKQQAELWVEVIKETLSNRNLISIEQMSNGKIVVRPRQQFKDAYVVERANDNCAIGVRDSYGSMTGAENWHIDPNSRTITAKTTNADKEPLQFLWIVDEDDKGEIWQEMNKNQKKIWQLN